jgi:hypothetical protein
LKPLGLLEYGLLLPLSRTPLRRTSENSVHPKFGELPFYTLGWIRKARDPSVFRRRSGRDRSRSRGRSRGRGRRAGLLGHRVGLLGRRNGLLDRLLDCHGTSWWRRWGGFPSIPTNTPEEEPQQQPYSEHSEHQHDEPSQSCVPPPWAAPSPVHLAIPSLLVPP